jgi:hypothetical protein
MAETIWCKLSLFLYIEIKSFINCWWDRSTIKSIRSWGHKVVVIVMIIMQQGLVRLACSGYKTEIQKTQNCWLHLSSGRVCFLLRLVLWVIVFLHFDDTIMSYIVKVKETTIGLNWLITALETLISICMANLQRKPNLQLPERLALALPIARARTHTQLMLTTITAFLIVPVCFQISWLCRPDPPTRGPWSTSGPRNKSTPPTSLSTKALWDD